MSLAAPRAGIFLVGMNLNQWGPDGPRKLQPGDNVWPGFPMGTIPDPTRDGGAGACSPRRTTAASPRA